MRNLLLFISFILGLVLLVQAAQAQTADEIIEKHLAARGGKENLRGMKTLVMEGSKSVMGNDVMIKITKVQDKLSRTDFEFGGSPGYMILTPTKGWNYIPMRSTKPDELPEERVKSMQGELDIAGPLVDYAAKGHKVELQGTEMVNDVKAYKIRVTLNSGRDVYYFIDTKDYMVIETRTTTENQKGEKVEQVTNYSDYKVFDNVKFPQTVNIQGSGMNAGATIFDKISLNQEISEKFYKPE